MGTGSERTAVVTGGHGFLGGHLVDRLLGEGIRVRCLLRPGRPVDVLRGLPVEVARGDLRHPDGLDEAVRGADVVYHVAGLIAARGPSEFHEVNVAGTRRLAASVRRAAPACRRFVYVSSQAAGGPSPDGRPLDETASPRPVSHYGRSKLRGELVLPRALGGIPHVVLRPPAIYGPRDEGILPFFQLASRGLAAGLEGAGRRFDLLHVRDVVTALVRAGEREEARGQVYCLAAGGGYGHDQLAAALGRVFGRRLRRIPAPDLLLELAGIVTDEIAALTGAASVFGRQKAIELKQRWWLCSPAKAERDLGWKAQVGLEDGLAETARWYADRGLVRPPQAAAGSL